MSGSMRNSDVVGARTRLAAVWYSQARNFIQSQITDPVINYHDPQCETKRGQYGKTDRGAMGIEDFLNTHIYNAFCDLVTTGYFECTNAVDV
jgi:hypothetical protein